MADVYLVNGTSLTSAAWAISTAEDLQVAPEWRDNGQAIPSAHGELDAGSDPTSQRRAYQAGTIKFTGWVKGVDPTTGLWSGSSLSAYFARVSELQRLWHARNLVLEHQRPDGSRFADGHLVGSVAPAREPSSPWFGRWSATVKIPGCFWRAGSALSASATVVTGSSIDLSAFAVGEAPIADGTLTFGPSSNPTWTHDGAFCRYAGVISAGRQLTIDCGTWTLGSGTGSAWTPDPSLIQYGPGPAWYELDPTAASTATFTHTGAGTAFAGFAGKPKFLTS